jgi:hypothetical protein
VSNPLIRFAKRLSSWEPAISDDDLLDTEFRDRSGRPDLRPSVYAIDPADVVKAFAEHSTTREPPSSTGGVDLGGTGRSVADTLGETGFAFTMEAHREIELASRDDLLALVREVRGSLAERTYPVTRDQVRAYVRARLALGDQEWARAQAQDTAKKWLKKLSA